MVAVATVFHIHFFFAAASSSPSSASCSAGNRFSHTRGEKKNFFHEVENFFSLWLSIINVKIITRDSDLGGACASRERGKCAANEYKERFVALGPRRQSLRAF